MNKVTVKDLFLVVELENGPAEQLLKDCLFTDFYKKGPVGPKRLEGIKSKIICMGVSSNVRQAAIELLDTMYNTMRTYRMQPAVATDENMRS